MRPPNLTRDLATPPVDHTTGPLPVAGPPELVEGSGDTGSALPRRTGGSRCTVAAINHRISVGKLRRLVRPGALNATPTH